STANDACHGVSPWFLAQAGKRRGDVHRDTTHIAVAMLETKPATKTRSTTPLPNDWWATWTLPPSVYRVSATKTVPEVSIISASDRPIHAASVQLSCSSPPLGGEELDRLARKLFGRGNPLLGLLGPANQSTRQGAGRLALPVDRHARDDRRDIT